MKEEKRKGKECYSVISQSVSLADTLVWGTSETRSRKLCTQQYIQCDHGKIL